MAPHCSTLAWKIPWTEEPGRLQPMGSLRVGHDWATSFSLFTFMHWRRKWQPTLVFLLGESQGWGAWWAAVYGVAQSRTRLKWFSSSRCQALCWLLKMQLMKPLITCVFKLVIKKYSLNKLLAHSEMILCFECPERKSMRYIERCIWGTSPKLWRRGWNKKVFLNLTLTMNLERFSVGENKEELEKQF